MISRNTNDETQLGSVHHPIRIANYVSSSHDIKTTATIHALTGSFSYLTGSSPIVIDADNIKVSSAGVVSGISSIDAATLNFNSLPTVDPEISGRLYRSGKSMQISTGSGVPQSNQGKE